MGLRLVCRFTDRSTWWQDAVIRLGLCGHEWVSMI